MLSDYRRNGMIIRELSKWKTSTFVILSSFMFVKENYNVFNHKWEIANMIDSNDYNYCYFIGNSYYKGRPTTCIFRASKKLFNELRKCGTDSAFEIWVSKEGKRTKYSIRALTKPENTNVDDYTFEYLSEKYGVTGDSDKKYVSDSFYRMLKDYLIEKYNLDHNKMDIRTITIWK